MQRFWFYVVLLVIVFLPFVSNTLVEHAKRGSEQWQRRPDWTRRVLAVLPGVIVAVAILVLLTVIHPPWF